MIRIISHIRVNIEKQRRICRHLELIRRGAIECLEDLPLHIPTPSIEFFLTFVKGYFSNKSSN